MQVDYSHGDALESFKLIDPLLGVSLPDAAECLEFVSPNSDVLCVDYVIGSFPGVILDQGKFRLQCHELSLHTLVFLNFSYAKLLISVIDDASVEQICTVGRAAMIVFSVSMLILIHILVDWWRWWWRGGEYQMKLLLGFCQIILDFQGSVLPLHCLFLFLSLGVLQQCNLCCVLSQL